MAIRDTAKRIWNAFRNPIVNNEEIVYGTTSYYGGGSPSRTPLRVHSERGIITPIITRIGMDVAQIAIKHVNVNDKKQFLTEVDSALNTCLTLEPNIDQGPTAFRQDIATTMFERGCAAIVPVDTASKPGDNGFTDIYTLRVAEILEWYAKVVRVNLWHAEVGQREQIVLPKRAVAIIENPLYAIMNEPNSTLQRLTRKLGQLDAVDDQSSSGKLDIIVQLPYVIKSESKQAQATKRREDIEFQLRGSKYGIAYIDGTEKVIQLNRPAENNLLEQVKYLTALLYDQLGLTEEVLNGTADEAAMNNYFNRTVMPVVDAIVEGMNRIFIGANGVKRSEAIQSFRDHFKFTSVKDLAEAVDVLSRNEVATPNEVRPWFGLPPSEDPKADKLVNSNMPQPEVRSDLTTLERTRQNGS